MDCVCLLNSHVSLSQLTLSSWTIEWSRWQISLHASIWMDPKKGRDLFLRCRRWQIRYHFCSHQTMVTLNKICVVPQELYETSFASWLLASAWRHILATAVMVVGWLRINLKSLADLLEMAWTWVVCLCMCVCCHIKIEYQIRKIGKVFV